MLLAGRVRGRDSYGIWDGHVHTDVFKMDNKKKKVIDKDLLHSTRNFVQYYVTT